MKICFLPLGVVCWIAPAVLTFFGPSFARKEIKTRTQRQFFFTSFYRFSVLIMRPSNRSSRTLDLGASSERDYETCTLTGLNHKSKLNRCCWQSMKPSGWTTGELNHPHVRGGQNRETTTLMRMHAYGPQVIHETQNINDMFKCQSCIPVENAWGVSVTICTDVRDETHNSPKTMTI